MVNSKLGTITNDLLAEEEHYGKIKELADALYDLFSEACQLDVEQDNNREGIMTSYGKAISVFEAAFCTKEFMRTQQFLRGIRDAIIEAKRQFPNEVIRVFYAGTGPFATLMLPMTTLFSPSEVQFTLLEINRETILHLKQVIAHFDVSAYIDQIIEADASTFELQEKGKHHILLTETMQHALIKEPQVAITLNLLPQMHEHCILVPENIVIDLAVIDTKRDVERLMGDPLAAQDYCLKLGNVINFNKKTAMQILRTHEHRQPIEKFSCHSVQCRSDLDNRFRLVNLMTEIQVFGKVWLKPYQCSLNLPLRISNDTKLVTGNHTLDFYYEISDTPQLKWV